MKDGVCNASFVVCGASVALLVFFDSLPRLILRIWKLCFHGINRVSPLCSFIPYFFRGNGKNSNLSLTLHALVRLLVSLTHSVSTQFFSPLVDVSFIISTRPPSHHRRSLSDVRRERFWCLADHQQHPSLFCSFLSLGCTTAKADIHKLTTHTQEQQQQKKRAIVMTGETFWENGEEEWKVKTLRKFHVKLMLVRMTVREGNKLKKTCDILEIVPWKRA